MDGLLSVAGNAVTVSSLIAELRKLPPDAEVVGMFKFF
jgi:hypothetical protein